MCGLRDIKRKRKKTMKNSINYWFALLLPGASGDLRNQKLHASIFFTSHRSFGILLNSSTTSSSWTWNYVKETQNSLTGTHQTFRAHRLQNDNISGISRILKERRTFTNAKRDNYERAARTYHGSAMSVDRIRWGKPYLDGKVEGGRHRWRLRK